MTQPGQQQQQQPQGGPAPPPDPPSFREMVEIMKGINSPTVVTSQAPPEDRGLLKHAATVMVVIAGALCVWVGTSLTSLSTQVTALATTMESVNKATDDIRATQGQTAKDVADLRASVSRDDQRITTNETAIGRLSDRIRVLEGQPPIPRGLRPTDP